MKVGADIGRKINGRKEQTMKECGNCKYHYHEDIDDGWVCVNPRSRFCTDWTEYEDTCEAWEEKGADDE